MEKIKNENARRVTQTVHRRKFSSLVVFFSSRVKVCLFNCIRSLLYTAIATTDAVVVADVMLSLVLLLNDAYSFCGSSVKGCPVMNQSGKGGERKKKKKKKRSKEEMRNIQSVSQSAAESFKGCLY